MSDQSPSQGRDSRLAISGWPLRSKVALALAIPLLLAATFGGLRVTNDLEQSNNASASSQQVTVVRPAIAYLTASEKGMVAAQSSTGTSQNELDDALVEIKAAADERDPALVRPGGARAAREGPRGPPRPARARPRAAHRRVAAPGAAVGRPRRPARLIGCADP